MLDTLPALLRSRLALFPFLLLLLLLFALASSSSSSAGTHRYPPSFAQSPPTNLAEEIELSEAVYQETVRERHEYIRRLGGPRAIDTFPVGGYDTPWTVWDFFPPTFGCPHRVERVGMLGDGGKWVCGLDVVAQKPNPIVYSFGVNTESSFEAAIMQRAPGAEVYGYDFSVDGFGPEITENPDFSRRAHFFKYAIGVSDAHGPGTNPDFQMYRLETLMQLNGHSFVDILKIDIEGSEFLVLASLLSRPRSPSSPSAPPPPPLPIGQLQVEIHMWYHDIDFRVFQHWFEYLEEMGFRPFRNEPNLVYTTSQGAMPYLVEYSFVNIKGNHELVSDVRSG